MGRPKKVIPTELEADEFIPKVGMVNKLAGKFIGNFSGNDYNHSVQLAGQWAKRHNADKSLSYIVVIRNYYEQYMPAKKSILVSYDKIFKEALDETSIL